MNPDERLNLQKMIDVNDVKDNTSLIRTLKHSDIIKEEVITLNKLKKQYERLAKTNPTEFDAICVSRCNFLFNNYTDIFNKVVKNEIDMNILAQLLETLKLIEAGTLDQHEGSFQIGKILKRIYIDSALKKAEHLDKKYQRTKKVKKKPEKKLSWKDFKKLDL